MVGILFLIFIVLFAVSFIGIGLCIQESRSRDRKWVDNNRQSIIVQFSLRDIKVEITSGCSVSLYTTNERTIFIDASDFRSLMKRCVGKSGEELNRIIFSNKYKKETFKL